MVVLLTGWLAIGLLVGLLVALVARGGRGRGRR
jgi:hypothetical protein